MTIDQINKALERRDELTDQEKENVRKAIINNPKANEIATRGAIIKGNYELAGWFTMKRLIKQDELSGWKCPL